MNNETLYSYSYIAICVANLTQMKRYYYIVQINIIYIIPAIY